jgi:hypothetical protein
MQGCQTFVVSGVDVDARLCQPVGGVGDGEASVGVVSGVAVEGEEGVIMGAVGDGVV